MLLVSFEPLLPLQSQPDEEMGWSIMSDPERAAYRAYGLERTNFVRAWLSPRTVAYYLRAAAAGRRIRLPQSDSRQLGGDFVIDAQGSITFAHRSTEPADRPPVERLIAAIRTAAEQRRGG